MRRSAVPSRAGASTKRFKSDVFPCNVQDDQPERRSTSDVIGLIAGVDQLPEPAPTSEVKASPGPDVLSAGNGDKYFSVVWCKLSARKHKKWEADAVLVVKNRIVVLKDLAGKEIGRGIGYKNVQLEDLDEGKRLVVGNKEVEIMNRMSSATDCLATSGNEPLQKKSEKSVCYSLKRKSLRDVSVFDPLKPGALVMPRPSAAHQWKNNPNKFPVVDVVVDPFLSSKLRPHQRDGVVFLYECVMQMRNFNGRGAILADEMGLGKTLQCITLIWILLKQGPYGACPVLKRILVVTPSSLVKNWEKEFNLWLGKERLRVCAADESEKISDYAKTLQQPVLITSYELMTRHHDILLAATAFDLMICDEGHRLKNSSTKTASLLCGLPIQRRILLTGTPIQNDLREFYALVEFCNPAILGSTAAFRKWYEEPITASRQPGASDEETTMGKSRAAELAALTEQFVLRRTQDLCKAYLLPKIEYVVFCNPSPLQASLYKAILESKCLRSILDGSSHDGAFHLVCISALKKLCNHPVLVFDSVRQRSNLETTTAVQSSPYNGLLTLFPSGFAPECIDATLSGKLAVLTSLLDTLHRTCIGEKIVLVSSSKKMLDVFERLCNDRDYATCRLDGNTPAPNRQTIVDRFNSPFSNLFAFLLSTKAGGVGLSLVGASRIVLYDIDWNPANDLQALSRVWRDGQTRVVHVYRLLTTGTIEEKILQRQVKKQDLGMAVFDSKDQDKVHFSLEELKTTSCATHDLLACKCFSGQAEKEEQPSLATRSLERRCQLDVDRRGGETKDASVHQLMRWEHFDGLPLSQEGFQASCLQDVLNVSCLFSKRSEK